MTAHFKGHNKTTQMVGLKLFPAHYYHIYYYYLDYYRTMAGKAMIFELLTKL